MGLMQFSTRCLIALAALAATPRLTHAASTCTVPGFDVAAFGDQGISIQNGNTDSWNSDSGSYASTKCTGSSCLGTVETNNGASGSISLGPNGSVLGQCEIGAGGSTSTISNSGNCSSTSVQGSTVTLSTPTLPSSGVTALGSISSTTTIPSAGAYSASSISLAGNKSLNVNAGPVVIYLTGSGSVLSLAGNASINNNTHVPSNLVFMCTSTATPQSISVVGNGNAYFAIYCPKADITITGNGAIYGAVVGKTVSFSGNNGYIHYDAALATYGSSAITCSQTEVSRATPVVATLTSSSCSTGSSCAALVQGTFVPGSGTKPALSTHASVSSWTFPYITGHMRARDAAQVTTSASAYSGSGVLFDASGNIPAPNYSTCSQPLNGSCRYIFTNTNSTPSTSGTTFRPSTVAFLDSNASTIGAKIAPSSTYTSFATYPNDYTTVIRTILGGSLGGVDRSTVAVIGPSTFTSSPGRPTMAYFGATDGMIHAVCASTGGTTASQSGSVCPTQGKELWAFMPRVQLPLVRTNDQRIDGSVHVIDAFGDFSAGQTGGKSWHTILTFQTGYADTSVGAAPAAYAIDVTDPASPVLLWEYTTPSSAAAADFGTGLVATPGPTLAKGAQKNLVILETNNGGTGSAGVVVTALNLEDGSTAWTSPFSYTYPAAASVPVNAVPGGAVGVDLTGNGYVTDVVFGDIYGDLWRLDTTTGSSQTGASTPLFSFTYNASSDKHPIGAVPAIYSDGNNVYAAFTSGGYADQRDAATTWAAGTQYLVSVKVKAGSPPVHETASASNSATGDLRLKQALPSGTKGYSQPTIVGNQLFATSDSADVNTPTYGQAGTASGSVVAFNGINASNASEQTYTSSNSSVYAGGSSLVAGVNSAGVTVLYGASADKQVQVGTAAITSGGSGVAAASGALGTGTSVSLTSLPKLVRQLWLRTM